MDTDEQVRKEIDRKAKIDLIKAKNQDELYASVSKYKINQSPSSNK